MTDDPLVVLGLAEKVDYMASKGYAGEGEKKSEELLDGRPFSVLFDDGINNEITAFG